MIADWPTRAALDRSPRDATTETWELVLDGIASGLTIRAACAAVRKADPKRRPTDARFLDWAFSKPEILDRYYEARKKGSERRIDAASTVIAEAKAKVETIDPSRISGMVAVAKLSIEQRRWDAGRLNAKVYGDRQQHEHSGNVSLTLATGVPGIGETRDVQARVIASNTVPAIDAAPAWIDDDSMDAARATIDWG